MHTVVEQACVSTLNKIGDDMKQYATDLNKLMEQQTKLLQSMAVSLKPPSNPLAPDHVPSDPIKPSAPLVPTPTPVPTKPAPPPLPLGNLGNTPSTPSTFRFTNMPTPKGNSANSAIPHRSTGSSTTTHHPRQSSIQRAGTVTFTYDGNQYELNDTHFLKYSRDLQPVTSKQDLIQFYIQIQAMAVIDNIFLAPFDSLTEWDKSPTTIPTTCLLQSLSVLDNTVEAYTRMKSALYTKVAKAKFENLEYKAIVDHHATTQDGFEVLYDIACYCHPKLVSTTSKVRDTNPRPVMKQSDTIYTFVKAMQTWIEIEQINGVCHSEMKIIDIVLEELRTDTRYEAACTGIIGQLSMTEAYNRQFKVNDFPTELMLQNLPKTVMSYYTDEEKLQLFPTQSADRVSTLVSTPKRSNTTTDQLCASIIKSIKDNKNLSRKAIDAFCQGCGKYGHDAFQTGCDFCAQLLIARNFMETNPNSAKQILKKYKTHQHHRQPKHSKEKSTEQSTTKPPRRQSYRQRRARIKQATDVLATIFDESDEESGTNSDQESYHDATAASGSSDGESNEE